MRLIDSQEYMNSLNKKYRPQLDVLRAIAIGLVLAEHFGGTLTREYFPIGPGALGVHLFFVLSGFLICRNLLTRLACDNIPGRVIRHFYITRVARLMPAYYLTIFVCFIFGVPQVRDFVWWHILYGSNYLYSSGGPLVVFWTLAVEEQFYLILPLLILCFRRDVITIAFLLIVIGFITRCAVLATPFPLFSYEVTILGNFEILGIGVLIGGLSFAGYRMVNDRLLQTAALCCVLFQAVAWDLWGNGIVRHLTFNLTVGVFFAWLVLLADVGVPGILAWLSRFSLVRFVGKISYGIYLMHWVFPLIFESQTVIAVIGKLPLPVEGIIVLLLSFIVPALSWILIESPILRLKDRLLKQQTIRFTETRVVPMVTM